jgi:hypothetical protein
VLLFVLLQNGETTASETTALQAAGWTVDQASPAQRLADSASTFKSYAVLVIGDPSTTSSCGVKCRVRKAPAPTAGMESARVAPTGDLFSWRSARWAGG